MCMMVRLFVKKNVIIKNKTEWQNAKEKYADLANGIYRLKD